jgi:inner membrane transporter RhtA
MAVDIRNRERAIPGPALVLTGILTVQAGNAWASTLFHRVGAGGAGLERLAWAMAILMLLYRPALRGRSRHEWVPALALGLVLASMNLIFYHAISRLPLGIAVTVEFIGPMGVAIAHSHRRRDLVWVLLAAGGIISLAHGSSHDLSLLGLVLAAAAGVCWGVYILVQARLGRAFSNGSGLALAMLVAAAAAIPDGVIEGGSTLVQPHVLAIGLGVGLLSSVIPYSLELKVLRRMSPGVFGVLMSMEPAAAAVAGVVILGQRLSTREVIGIGLVSAASLGISLFGGGGESGPAQSAGEEAPEDTITEVRPLGV